MFKPNHAQFPGRGFPDRPVSGMRNADRRTHQLPARYLSHSSAVNGRQQAPGRIPSARNGLLFDQMIARLHAFDHPFVGVRARSLSGLRDLQSLARQTITGLFHPQPSLGMAIGPINCTSVFIVDT